MEKEEAQIQEVAIITPLEFSPVIYKTGEQKLRDAIASVKEIDVDPENITKEGLEVVSNARKMLSKAKSFVKEAGLADRQATRDYNSASKAYENGLIEEIDPELERLKGIEADAKAKAIRAERLKTLPEFKEKLATIGDEVGTDMSEEEFDDFLLLMDPPAREEYYNDRRAAHLDAKEAAQKEADEKAEAEKAQIAADKEKIRLEKLNGRKQRLFVARFTEMVSDEGRAYAYDTELHIDEEQLELIEDAEFNEWFEKAEVYIAADQKKKEAAAEEQRQADLKAAEEKAAQTAKEEAKKKAAQVEADRLAKEEADKKAEEERQAAEEESRKKREAEEGFQKWKEDHSYNADTDALIEDQDATGKVTILYREVSRYSHTV